MTIKILNENSADDIFAIDSRCFSSPWDKSVILGTIKQSSYRYFGVYNEDLLCGYASVTLVAGECYINRIAVEERFRRLGAADMLMNAIIGFCAEFKAGMLSLEVRSGNEPAINLYKKHGLCAVGRRRDFYADPKEDAVIMTRFFA